jgi:hypothetical protein
MAGLDTFHFGTVVRVLAESISLVFLAWCGARWLVAQWCGLLVGCLVLHYLLWVGFTLLL